MDNFDLERIFSTDLIYVDAELKTRTEVFNFVARKLQENKKISAENIQEIAINLQHREDIGSTGLGKGIAIPHIVLKEPDRLFGCVIKSEKGIDWGSIDGKPVKLIVFLFASENRRGEYLKIIAEVARIVNMPNMMVNIIKEKRVNNIYQMLVGNYEPNIWQRYSRAIYFIAGLVIFFVLAKVIFSHINLPNLEIYQKLDYLRFNERGWINKEIFSMTLFFSMVLGTLLFFRYRVAFGAAALSLLLVAGVMDIETTVKFMSIPTILFIISVMVLVKWLEDKGVFEFLVVKALKYFYHSPLLLFGALMFFSAILAGLVDEVSAILITCLLYTSPSPRDRTRSRMPSSA